VSSWLHVRDADDSVRWITIDRPRANAIDLELAAQVRAALPSAHDEHVRCVVITAQGRMFSVGADLKAIAGYSAELTVEFIHEIRRAVDAVARCRVPTIAAINGDAFGGGFELALACDLRVACAGARLALPEVRHSLIPGAGGTQRLLELIGPARAVEIMMRARVLPTTEALALGILTEVCADDADALAATAQRLAAELAAMPEAAVAAIRDVVATRLEHGRDAGFEAECAAILRLLAAPAARELIALFTAPRERSEHNQ
jgi:enoyl-CoA hydratase